eukprot:2666838-Amphidinium_carterae.1
MAMVFGWCGKQSTNTWSSGAASAITEGSTPEVSRFQYQGLYNHLWIFTSINMLLRAKDMLEARHIW